MSYAFNTDLMLNEADRAEAKRAFSDIFFALDNEILRETFRPYDERANKAKTRSRRWGVFAVFLATGALLLAGGEMLYHDLPKNQLRLLAGLGGIAGIVSVIIGVFGVMFRKRKMRWLADRLATERIRQFHFQSYVAGAPEILKGAKSEDAAEKFIKKRALNFDNFQAEFLANIDHILHDIVHKEDAGEGRLLDDRIMAETMPASDDLGSTPKTHTSKHISRPIRFCDLIGR